MPIQVIQRRQEAPRKQSFDEKWGAAIHAGLGVAGNAVSNYQQRSKEKEFAKQVQAKEEKENEFFKEKYGEDLSKASPKEKEMFFASKLREEQKRQELNDKMKAYGDAGLGEYFQDQGQSGEFGQQEGRPASFSDQISRNGGEQRGGSDQFNDQGEIEVGDVKLKTDKLIPEKKIALAAAIDPAIAREMRAHNTAIEKRQIHEENLEFKNKKESPEHKRETAMAAQQAKADTDYNKGLQESAGLAHIKTKTLTDLEKLNEKGVTGKPYEKLLEKMGLVNLTSEGRREFAADVKHMITDIRSILGGQFSNFEFQTILNAYPSADFSQGANRAIINNLKEFQDIKNKEIEFANQIKKNNGGKIPQDYQALVNQKVKEYADDRLPSIKANNRKVMHEEYGIPEGNYLMFSPEGEPLNVPEEMIDHYMELGANLP